MAYADSKGESHYYIEAAAVAELFDVTGGVNLHEEANQLEFGAKGRVLRDKEGNPTGEMDWGPLFASRQRHDFTLFGSGEVGGDGMDSRTMVISSEGFPVIGDNGSSSSIHSNGRGPSGANPELQKEQWARQKSLLKEKPGYGQTFGMYTEVDPAGSASS